MISELLRQEKSPGWSHGGPCLPKPGFRKAMNSDYSSWRIALGERLHPSHPISAYLSRLRWPCAFYSAFHVDMRAKDVGKVVDLLLNEGFSKGL